MRRRQHSSPPSLDRVEALLQAPHVRRAPWNGGTAHPPVSSVEEWDVGVDASPAQGGESGAHDLPANVGLTAPLAEALARAQESGERPTLLTLPAGFRRAQIRPRWAALAGLVVVALVAAVVLGVRVWSARSAADPVPVAASGSGDGSRGAKAGSSTSAATPGRSGVAEEAGQRRADGQAKAGGAGAPGATASGVPSSAPSSASPTSALLVVDVVGAVAHPGVVRIAAGGRVADAVTAVGGLRDDADPSAVNMARLVADGEQILVPVRGQAVTPSPSARSGTGAPAGRQGASGAATPSAPVDLNTADEAALDALPGVGPVTAAHIVQWRAEHGRFSRVEELAEVQGIGPKLVAQLTPLVKV